ILAGIEVACGKLPIPADLKQSIVDDVEESLYRDFDREVKSSAIGERVAERLRRLNHVAYVRFASEYKQFRDLDDLVREGEEIRDRAMAGLPGQGELFDSSDARSDARMVRPETE